MVKPTNGQTDTQEIYDYLEIVKKTTQECLQKNLEKYLIQYRRYPFIGLIPLNK